MYGCRVFGKFILSGEHTVLRGGPALIFPVRSRQLDLMFKPEINPLEFHSEGPIGSTELNLVFWSILERALRLAQRNREEIKGKLVIRNNIPLSSGLGASAALCVAIGKWFVSLGFITEDQLFSFSRNLEDLFHGESSGVDVAVAIKGCGILYRRYHDSKVIENHLKPKLYLSASGMTGTTSECVAKVKLLIERDPQLGADIDAEMNRSSEMALRALSMEGEEGLSLLTDAMSKSRNCFERWGLADSSLQEQMVHLLAAGARAVKPTGSGGGGYILSLWNKTPHLPGLIET